MRIGILGTGDVGKSLGTGFARLGHEVKMGVRPPQQEKIKVWLKKTGQGVSAGTCAEAAIFAEVAVLATHWESTKNVIRSARSRNLAGKIVIDTTNPLDFSNGGPPTLLLGYTNSGGEEVQRWLPKSYVVKAFNTVGSPHMVNPQFAGGPPDMFICGNHGPAKQTVTDFLKAFGWSVVDIGGIEGARYLEPLAMIWIISFFKTQNGNHAFKLLRM